MQRTSVEILGKAFAGNQKETSGEIAGRISEELVLFLAVFGRQSQKNVQVQLDSKGTPEEITTSTQQVQNLGKKRVNTSGESLGRTA